MRYFLKILFCVSLFASSFQALSQAEIKVTNPGVSVNNNGNDIPDASALLDVNSDNKGVVFPRLTTIQRDAIENPVPGLLVFNSDNCVYEYFNGSSWQVIGLIPVQDVPNVPSDLSVEMNSETQVSLTWTDNSSNESGFTIERATNSDFSTGLSNFSVAADATSYVDNLNAGQNAVYYYRVKALNGCAESDVTGNTSNTEKLAYFPQNYSNLYASFDARLESNFILGSVPTFPPSTVGIFVDVWKNSTTGGGDLYALSTAPTFFKFEPNSLTLNERNTVRTYGAPGVRAQNFEDYNFLHQGNESFTVLGLVEPQLASDNGSFSICSSQSQGYRTGFTLSISGTNHPNSPDKIGINIKHGTGGATSIQLISTIDAVQDDTNLVIARYDASIKELKLTVKNSNGSATESLDLNSFPFNNGNSSVLFSMFHDGGATRTGKTSQLQIWKSFLSDTEVNDIADVLLEYYQ